MLRGEAFRMAAVVGLMLMLGLALELHRSLRAVERRALQEWAVAPVVNRDIFYGDQNRNEDCHASLRESDGLICVSQTNWDELKKIYRQQQEKQKGKNSNHWAGWFQNNYEPNFSCQFERRLGNIGDGGKWVCDVHRIPTLETRCLVYSIGSNNHFEFEISVHEALPNCEIHTFDHTVAAPKPPSFVHFHSIGLGATDSDKLLSFASIRKMLGHDASNSSIEILKIDVEGSEYSSLTPKVVENDFVGVRQLLIELHKPGAVLPDQGRGLVDAFFEAMDRRGYVIFHKEPNIEWAGGNCVEYGFLHLNWQP
uniref:Methyltransferase domain-containing protein n=1 Tax=Compsopogon caeruleus TaxID=31354 RepID=A0A7S1T979_9RHOD|mmetsp:Transcript_1304/g.2732  ORF Transcript_1304/g.2732 Transcript_1304/m.2732 type:complete len:310 (+) Transcript_1304:127-1056(+)|eukprot:CAMPEP_0184679772 /NCGR_PEP_ID=MMETSP0312-20130426/2646_1 /TAXON_ID=31354 /ORGANISM="Compsopogon coeruleus, Strain SAG 36.94" /LENGTH=309 /DNA_ID=CAMNT_0027129451 /DNA_START=108 /DNA_END=1037 /DNA_ORIENTATION=-